MEDPDVLIERAERAGVDEADLTIVLALHSAVSMLSIAQRVVDADTRGVDFHVGVQAGAQRIIDDVEALAGSYTVMWEPS